MSTVISVFMLGLALGSKAGGTHIVSICRKTGKSALLFYSLIEGFIGLGGLLVPALFNLGDNFLLSMGETDSTGYLLSSGTVILVSLLPWCFFMGATFPVAMQIVREDNSSNPESFSFLYLANVSGAVAGTLATAFVLVELLGFQGTLHMASGLNFTICLGAFLWLRSRLPKSRLQPKVSLSNRASILPGSNKNRNIPVFLFLTGFTSMAMEVTWVRDFTPILGNEIYAFAGLLAAYLTATGIGSWLYRRHLKKGKVFSTVLMTGLLALFPFFPVVLNDPNRYHSNVLALLSLVPFCAALGYLTPRLIDQWSGGAAEKGGRIYAWNILGCILGPLAASYLMLPYLGARWTLIVLSIPFLPFHFILNAKRKLSFHSLSVIAASLCLLLFSAFSCGSFEEGWNFSKWDRTELRRDHTATVLAYQKGNNKGLLINGLGVAYLTSITKVMAHFPLALCPHPPRSALVICFGMGTTFRSIASWGIDTTAVELVPSVKEEFGFSFMDASAILAKPNVRVVIDDGRRFLQRTRQKFDVITLDPAPPVEAAGSSLLYSDGFYRAIQRRLAPDGIVQQWIPGGPSEIQRAFIRSFAKSFPYYLVLSSFEGWGTHLIGSMQPITIPPIPELVSRIPPAAQKDFLEWNPTFSTSDLMKLVLSKKLDTRTLLGPDEKTEITDDRPLNEYYFLHRSFPAIFKY